MRRVFDKALQLDLQVDIFKEYFVAAPDMGGDLNGILVEGNMYHFQTDDKIRLVFQSCNTLQIYYGLYFTINENIWYLMDADLSEFYYKDAKSKSNK